ncbi:MAG: cytochrome c oxidase subunit I [Planctomycetaceae bacterium]|uniref:Cytochrome c oxidase subunit 1 n=1 Tax=Lacipirellula limnantheis TaxID=2528024 RepID=A0A517U2T7_9BACT|nr:cytochrome c oxidase subunit I [Lacipirellula limnantheis]MBL9165254.1 cytochrome c oxidase subunit I [Planctomycetaceae bacterium]QDT74945.1 Cytochrome c oxidase subunit 1 [Lacipirellula limnantheis]
MSAVLEHETAPAPIVREPKNYLNVAWTVRSWLLTVDHKRIGLLYLAGITFFFLLGGAAAGIFRLELMTPQSDLVESETYNKLFTLHGIIMIFFFLVPGIPGVLGNFLIPIMIGARDMAFPKLNLMSWYLFMIGGIFTLYVTVAGGVDTGWTFYTPYSSTYSNTYVMATAVGIFITGFSSILTGLNFIVTVHKMRCPGMTWFRLPLFVWSNYATALIMVLGTPVLAITILLVALERGLKIGIFDPRLGGDPVLFQHLFWFYSHPAVYIMVLPAMGVISELVAAFSRNRVFGYKLVAFASLAIAVLGFLVWGHHMFVSGQSLYAGMVFSVLSMLIAIPSAIKVFNWTLTLWRGEVTFNTPLLYAMGFLGLFTIGGLTGLFLATLGIDVHVHDTYFVVAHFHYVMVGGTVMAYLGGIHYWWPKMTGKMYPEGWARFSAVLVFVGFNLTFFPQFILGYLGMPRRYHVYDEGFQVLNVMSTAGASILGIAYLFPITYLIWSLKYGAKAPANPWNAVGLEWMTSSPPPTENFIETPVVDFEAYEYHRHPAERHG